MCTHIQLNTPTHIPKHTRTHSHINAHSAHPHIPMHTPHIPAYALNLINHMETVSNRLNTKKGDKKGERKKKEQDSAEAFQ